MLFKKKMYTCFSENYYTVIELQIKHNVKVNKNERNKHHYVS